MPRGYEGVPCPSPVLSMIWVITPPGVNPEGVAAVSPRHVHVAVPVHGNAYGPTKDVPRAVARAVDDLGDPGYGS